jgi:hypothetical protein
MRRVGGWHRLWIVTCVPLLGFGVLVAWENSNLAGSERAMLLAQYGLAPCVFVYAAGWAIGWVIRGFGYKHR